VNDHDEPANALSFRPIICPRDYGAAAILRTEAAEICAFSLPVRALLNW
jgi:hypothetical protein